MSSIALDLDFQDFSPQHPNTSSGTGINHSGSTSYAPDHQNQEYLFDKLNSSLGLSNTTPTSIDIHDQDLSTTRRQRHIGANNNGNWGLAYLAQYFDITTEEVVKRIIYSSIPVRKSVRTISPIDVVVDHSCLDGVPNKSDNIIIMRKYSYIERFIQSKPDLYGPLWICVTLIFTIAFFGNTSIYIEHTRLDYMNIKPGDNISMEQINKQLKEDWHYNFYQVNLAASCILSYVFIVPMLLWFFFWFRGCSYTYSLLETICAYGYSLAIFIPVSMVMLIQVAMIQYSVVSFGALLSGYVLVASFLPVVHSDPSRTMKSSYLILILIAASHALLAFTLHLKVMKPAS